LLIFGCPFPPPHGPDWSLLALFFHCFLEWPKNKKTICFSILYNGLGPSKTIDFPIDFHRFFMFFQNRSPGLFLEGPSADRLWKVGFWCRFRFSWFSKRHPLDTIFKLKALKTARHRKLLTSFSRPCFSRNHSNPCAVGT
jgi:hypothetical protein